MRSTVNALIGIPDLNDRPPSQFVCFVSLRAAQARALEQAEPRLAQVVEMRYFGGYSEVEIAEVLGVTERTVRRDWDKARLLLMSALKA